MAERLCTQCGGPLGRNGNAKSCLECQQTQRRLKERTPVVCCDCQCTFTPPGTTGRPFTRCEPCDKAFVAANRLATRRAWREKNREKLREQDRQQYWRTRANNPAVTQRTREQHIKRKHGITWDEYQQMVAAQGNVCAICSGPPKGAGHRLHIDHHHATGVIRGLLCSNCNIAIGLLADDPDRVEAVAHYLRRSQEV
jgi:hypothetical protein